MLVLKKQIFDYGDGKYLDFIKSNFWNLKPVFFSLISVATIECDMFVVELKTTEIENPDCEVVAQCFINNLHIYNWRNKFWMQAIVSAEKELGANSILHSKNTKPKGVCNWIAPAGSIITRHIYEV